MNTSVYLNLVRLVCGLSICGMAVSANAATVVDVEMALIIDSSSRVSASYFNSQKQAYYNIFTQTFQAPDTGQSTNFYNYFVAPLIGTNINNHTGIGKIAVSTIQFGDSAIMIMPWTEISSQSQATAFGNGFLGLTQFSNSGSNIGGAIDLATQGITNNDFTGSHVAFAVVTDGISDGTNPSVSDASSYALTHGVDVINAVAPDRANFPRFADIVGGDNLYNNPCSLFATDQCNYPVSGSDAVVVSSDVINVTLSNISISSDVVNVTLSNISVSADPLQTLANTLVNQLRVGLGTPIPQGDGTSVPEPSTISALCILGLLGVLSKLRGDIV